MFKKAERLSRSEFTDYFSHGVRKHTKHITAVVSPLKARKVAVVVGKKVAKSAVKRNRLKRRIYATLRKMLAKEYQGVIIVIVKPTFATLPRKTAEAEVMTMIAQVQKCA